MLFLKFMLSLFLVIFMKLNCLVDSCFGVCFFVRFEICEFFNFKIFIFICLELKVLWDIGFENILSIKFCGLFLILMILVYFRVNV